MQYYGTERRDGLHIEKLYTVFIEEYGNAFSFAGESHEMVEMDCILEGCVGITSGTHIYTCTAGQVVLHPANTFHTVWTVQKRARIMTVTFTGTGAWQGGQYEPTETEKQLVSMLRETVARDLAGRLLPAEGEADAAALQKVCNLTELLCLSFSARRVREVPPNPDARARRFSEIVLFLEEHICDALQVEDVCRSCNVSRSSLKELFNLFTGQSPMRYYNDMRLRYAMQLIKEGVPMCEIADRMHFSSPCYFSDFFRRLTGKTPKAFKVQI